MSIYSQAMEIANKEKRLVQEHDMYCECDGCMAYYYRLSGKYPVEEM